MQSNNNSSTNIKKLSVRPPMQHRQHRQYPTDQQIYEATHQRLAGEARCK